MSKNPSFKDRLKASFKIITKKGYSKHKDGIRKQLGLQMLNESYGYSDVYNYHPQDIYRPREKLSFRRRNRLFIDCQILRSVINIVNEEMHRNGLALKKEFTRKCRREYIEPCGNSSHNMLSKLGQSPIDENCGLCPNPKIPLGQDECGEEYDTEQIRCNDCRMPTRSPELLQKRTLRKYMKKPINNQNQMLTQVVRHVNMDVEKHDNGFFINQFTYTWESKDGIEPITPTGIIWKQTYRGDPGRLRPVIRKQGDLGSNFYTCILHREKYEMHEMNESRTGFRSNEIPRCDQNISANVHTIVNCNQILQRVYYVTIREEGSENDVVHSYIKDEVIHVKKYYPAGAMGISLIDSLYYSVLQVIGMEKWIAEYYLKMRMFKGFFTVPNELGGEQSTVQKFVYAEFAKWRQDPYYTPIFGIPKDSKDMAYHRVDDKPSELQLIENRQETRQTIANSYGVANKWMNDTSTGAGLNNDGVDIMTTNRHIKFGQGVMENQGLKKLCASWLNVAIEDVEWYIGYNPHEEQDLMAEKQRTALDIANARAAQEVGADVYINAEREFVFAPPSEGEPLVPLAQKMTNANIQPYQDVEGSGERGMPYERRAQSKPFQGAPNEPKMGGGTGMTTKSISKGNGSPNGKITIEKATTADVFDMMEINKKSDLIELHYSELVNVINNEACFVAKSDDKIVAYSINLYDQNTNMLHLVSIAVDGDYKRMGIANKMVKEGIMAARLTNFSGIRLEVRESNSEAIEFYKNTGFATKEISQGFYSDGESAVVMELLIEKTSDKISFKYEYRWDWENANDYVFEEFKTIGIEEIQISDDYGLTEGDVRHSTINFFLDNPKGIPALVVERTDDGYFLKDGFHRLFVLKQLHASKVLVAIVEKYDPVMTSSKYPVMTKATEDPDFNEKHPRDEGGKFQGKPKMESEDEASEAGVTGGSGQVSDEILPPGVSEPDEGQPTPPTEEGGMNGGGGGKQPKGNVLSHLMNYGGFIMNQDLQYFEGGGYWVGIPFEPNFTLVDEIDDSILNAMIKEEQAIIAQLPPMNYVINGWIQDDKVCVGIGEIHDNIDAAKFNANENYEGEIWDFDVNTSVIIKTNASNDEIVYDFFARRGRYWDNKQQYLSLEEYIQNKASEY